MNKRIFKSYLKGSTRNILQENCFEHDNGYLISDSFSIIKLNQTYDLKINNDELGLSKLFDNFKDNYNTSYTFKNLNADNEDRAPINETYSINVKLYNKIKSIIKADWCTILEPNNKENNYAGAPIIKLENTKTKELAYLLPMRTY